MNTQLSTELAALNGLRILVYGAIGSGKTMLAATATRPFLISCEAGLLSLSQRNVDRVLGEGVPPLPTVEVKTSADLKEAMQWLFSSAEPKQYTTICIDSLSELANIVLRSALKQVKDGRQAYGFANDYVQGLLASLQKLPVDFYVAAQQDKGDPLTTGPMLPGQAMGKHVPWWFDEVFCLRHMPSATNPQQRWLQTTFDGLYEAKDRSGMLEPWEPPNLASITAKIKGGF